MTTALFLYLLTGFITGLLVIRKELDDYNYVSLADVIWYIVGGMIIGVPMLISFTLSEIIKSIKKITQ